MGTSLDDLNCQDRERNQTLLYGKCGGTQSRTERQRSAVLPAKTYKIKTGVKGFS